MVHHEFPHLPGGYIRTDRPQFFLRSIIDSHRSHRYLGIKDHTRDVLQTFNEVPEVLVTLRENHGIHRIRGYAMNWVSTGNWGDVYIYMDVGYEIYYIILYYLVLYYIILSCVILN